MLASEARPARVAAPRPRLRAAGRGGAVPRRARPHPGGAAPGGWARSGPAPPRSTPSTSPPADVEALGRSGTTVCACPTTERDLGDGVVPADELLRAGACSGAGHATPTSSWTSSRRPAPWRATCASCAGSAACSRPPDGEGRVDALAARLHGFASAGGMRSLGLPGRHARPGGAGRLRLPRPRRPVHRRRLARPTSCRPCSSRRPAPPCGTSSSPGRPALLDGAPRGRDARRAPRSWPTSTAP